MNNLATSQLTDIIYTHGNSGSAKNFYNQIKSTFSQNKEYELFAEPIIMGDGKIMWITNIDGEVINYKKLNQEQQSQAKALLSQEMEKLFASAKRYEDETLLEFLKKSIEIPSLDDIYLIHSKEGEKVVLTRWGFLSDVPGAEKGLLFKIIEAPRIPMPIQVLYEDGSPAEEITFTIEYERKKQEFTSNHAGIITIPKVKEDSFVKAYRLKDGEQTDLNTFTCRKDEKYTITIPLILDMKFRVVTSINEGIASEAFTLSYNSAKFDFVTDVNGEFTVKSVPVGTMVTAFPKNAERSLNTNNFTCEKGRREYLIVILAPQTKKHPMRFKVIDEKDKVIANAEVTVMYNGKKEVLQTDAEGYAVLEDVEPNTKVKVIAKAPKKDK